MENATNQDFGLSLDCQNIYLGILQQITLFLNDPRHSLISPISKVTPDLGGTYS